MLFYKYRPEEKDTVAAATAGGIVLASVDLLKSLGQVLGGANFTDGLCIVTTGAAKLTINYE